MRDEPAQRLELGDRQRHLRLVVRVLVHVGAIGVQRARQRLVGVRLDAQRLRHGQHLGQERQIRAEGGVRHTAQELLRFRGDGLLQTHSRALHDGRAGGVRAHPQLGVRLRAIRRGAGVALAERGHLGVTRDAPVVVLHRARQREHHGGRVGRFGPANEGSPDEK